MRKPLLLLASALMALALLPAVAGAQTVCGSSTPNWQCPPQSEFHPSFGPSNTFLNIGNAEARALNNLLAESRPRGVYERWTGTTYSYRRSNLDVMASIYVFNPNQRLACRGSYDVYGANNYFTNVVGHLEFCWYY